MDVRGARRGSTNRGGRPDRRRGGNGGGGDGEYRGRRPFRERSRGEHANANREGERARHSQRGRGGNRGGRNRRRQPRNVGDRVARLTPENIRQLASVEPDAKLVNQVDQQLKAFQEAIGDMKTPMPEVVKILSRIVSVASTRDSEEQGNASKIISEILSERSENFHFQLNKAVKNIECTIVQAEKFCTLFQSMLTTFESLSECLPVDELYETVKKVTKNGLLNSSLLKMAEDIKEISDQRRRLFIKKETPELVDGEERDDSEFKLIPILPEWKEIQEDSGTPPEVRPNKVDAPYKDWMEYYDIQFRLIREDFIAPLRRGVAAFLQGDKGKKNRDVKTYSRAKIVSQVTTKEKGICFTIQFDVSGFRRVNYNWDQSKRLIFGSLLCFIPMGSVAEDTIIFATVADRDSKTLSKGNLMVQFEGDVLEAMNHFRNKTEFEIVESNSYFGATSPILRSLQKAEVETMPFTKQLVGGECESVQPPSYLRNKDTPTTYNLSCLHGPVTKRRSKPPLMIEVLNKESWEVARDSELDSSQLNAIQTALTQEIAVIQGPPGTGKTYIGLKIVEGLLENRKIWDPHKSSPILVMCYTNHALDQFLEGIIDTECCGRKLDVIRVGGRCKNEKVEEHNLNKIRRNVPRRRNFGFAREFRALKEEIEECNPEKVWRSLNLHSQRKTLLPMFILQLVAHPYHYYQLTQMSKCAEQQGREVEVWFELWEERTKKRRVRKQPAEENEMPSDNHSQENDEREQVTQSEDKSQGAQETKVAKENEIGKMEHQENEAQPIPPEQESGDQRTEMAKQDEHEDKGEKEQQQNEARLMPPPEQESGDRGIEVAKQDKHEENKQQQNETELIPPTEQQSGENVLNSEALIEVEGEAILAQGDRMDEDDVEGFQRVEVADRPLEYDVYHEPSLSPHQKEEPSDESENEDEPTKKEQVIEEEYVIKSEWIRKKSADHTIRRYLFKTNLMDDEEVDEISNANLMSLSMRDRWRLYNYWEEQRYIYLQEENRKMVEKYSEKCRELAELRQREDRYILESADVVGMTTTGAAKYQHILHHIKPKIVIVEEAAEVLEAHIVSALSAGTQHLILIGDHKQLRPKPNEHVLATKYNLSISLFERLVMKQMSQATLEIQHRMRPQIARLVCPHVYEKLLNHESVEKYPDIRGISKNLFFIRHTEPESENPNLLSYQNEFEGKYIAGLCAHLLRLGYSPSQITILTPYVGQLLMLRNKMPKSKFEGVRVTAIDNFQGEENDIILFSMVRSTNPNSSRTTIGFVKEDNRVCVSLSRAKHGFYAIGNFELIRHQSQLWESIISDVESRGCYGDALPLYCCNHPETKYSAVKDSDFITNAPNGGCREMCDIRLPCGHACTRMCHATDTKHAMFDCKKICERECPYNHPCKSGHYCYKKCRKCREIVERVIPGCGHRQVMECWVEEKDFPCREIVTKIMPGCRHEQDIPCSTKPTSVLCQALCSIKCINGHPCQKLCYEKCGECQVDMEKVIPGCNHKQMVPCYLKPEYFNCNAPCPKLCPNGHPCPKECFESCGRCTLRVLKEVPECGHKQLVKCYQEPDPAKCTGECEELCPNGEHKLKKLCSEDWPRCTEKVTKTLPKCGHTVETQCFVDPSTILCNKLCQRSCEAGHKCLKLCREKCAPCPEKVQKTLLCGHSHVIKCRQASNNSFKCTTKCRKIVCEKGHVCKKMCHFPRICGVCSEMVTVQISTCSHKQTLKCSESTDPALYGHTCQHPCERKLECGHLCQNQCGKPCQKTCIENVKFDLLCGHQAIVKCHQKSQGNTLVINCKERVVVKIDCGHTIQTECYKQKYRSLLRKECNKECRKVLACGHACREPCGKLCTRECKKLVRVKRTCGHEIECECYLAHTSPCTKKCPKKLPCGHPCQNACSQPCSTKCERKLMRKYPCGHLAKIRCDSSIEDNPCKKNCTAVLSCGHNCSGRCGDCYSTRMHAVCIFEIKLNRYCGHSVTLPCAGLSDSCDHGTHSVPSCTHSADYSNCHEPCNWRCKHLQCTKECSEECNRPPCNEPCDKKLRCGHRCPGLCGERCMSVCIQCNNRKFMKMFYTRVRSKRGQLPRNESFFEIDCGHIFTVRDLDEYMEHPVGTVTPRKCPKCHQTIAVGSRYGNMVRGSAADAVNVERLKQDLWREATHSHATFPIGVPVPFRRILITRTPESNDERCLAQFVDSSLALYLSLQSHPGCVPGISSLCGQLEKLAFSLVKNTKRDPRPRQERMKAAALLVPERRQSSKLYFTFQLLNDFTSELYRVALRAQCLIAKTQNPPSLWSTMKAKLTGSRGGSAITSTEEYLDSLDPLKDRISKDTYEDCFGRITAAFPNLTTIHVQSPPVPLVVKGTWMKCPAGHYYCIPPICGTANTVDHRCQNCL